MVFNPVHFLLHIDEYIGFFIQNYGYLTYGIIFLIIFLETGLVFAPFLPGDSLLFVAGTFAGSGLLNIWILFVLLCLAAILGDSVNYFLGKYSGTHILKRFRFFKPEHLAKTQKFYAKHGGKTIIYARFIPIVRTFAPFVAGIGAMRYREFVWYNIVGGIAWVALFLFGGYYFGRVSFVRAHLTEVVLGIIILSLLPPLLEYIRHRFFTKKKHEQTLSS